MKVSEQRQEQLRREGYVANERALSRQLEAARRRRVADLVGAGLPHEDADAQAGKEFAEYDLIEIDPESGWVRIHGLNFSNEAPST